MDQLKRCTKCKVEKPFDLFNKDKTRTDGSFRWCRTCTKEYSAKYYKTKNGLVSKIFCHQKHKAKQRNMNAPAYTKAQLKEWLFSQPNFSCLFDTWAESGYRKELVPSVDRVNDYTSYTIENIQLMTFQENLNKAYFDMKNGINNKQNKAIVQLNKNGDLVTRFYSASEASRQTGLSRANINTCCRGGYGCKTVGGFVWKFKEDHNKTI